MDVTTSCSPRNFELLRSLGAKEVLDYHTQNIEDHVFNMDVFLDTHGYTNEELVFRATSRIMRTTG